MIKLTAEQKEHYASIKWLVSDEVEALATGRTLLLAMAFIDKARKQLNRRVYIYDHWHTLRANVNIISMITHAFKDMELDDLELIISSHTNPPFITIQTADKGR